VAERYAAALFELARDESTLDEVAGDLDSFAKLMDESPDLTRLVRSPVFTSEEQTRAVAAVRLGSGIVAYVGVEDGKAALAVGVTDDLKAKFSAVDLVRAGVAAIGGQGGGGRPDMAQGGGPEGAKAGEALAAIRAALERAAAA
jgi:alanyl-tRNA synthetase